MALEDQKIDELVAAADFEFDFDVETLDKAGFCSIYRSKVRKMLNAAIAILSFIKPSLATALKMIRAQLDEYCPSG